jgi:hypothetical protein
VESRAEKSLNLSLIFYPSGPIPYSIIDTIINGNIMLKEGWRNSMKRRIEYSIDIINDILIIIDHGNGMNGYKEYRGKLTDDQYLEVKKMVSALNQIYDWSGNTAYDAWGCILTLNNQIYYQDNNYSMTDDPHSFFRSTPKEIRLLIDYIVNLSPIPIKLNGFA